MWTVTDLVEPWSAVAVVEPAWPPARPMSADWQPAGPVTV